MRYYGYYDGALTLGLMINVINVGDTPVTAPNGRVSVAGVMLSGALYQYAGSATQPNTVNPWERGYIHVVVPTSLMAPCQTYAVQIDLDHTMQTGGAPVFANDSGSASTVCPLTWTTPIDELHLGTVPHWSVEGKSLSSIVSSFVSGRPDGALCSSCHNASASYPYHPNVAQNGSGLIGPYAPASGDQAWICTGDPWWHRFVFLPESTYPHTPYLREFVQKWVSDGAMP